MNVLRFDAGKIENSALVKATCASMQIITEPAVPGAQYQDPAERHLQTCIRRMATVLVSQRYLNSTFWGLSAISVAHTKNYCPSKKT